MESFLLKGALHFFSFLSILDDDIDCFDWAMDAYDQIHFDVGGIAWPCNEVNTGWNELTLLNLGPECHSSLGHPRNDSCSLE